MARVAKKKKASTADILKAQLEREAQSENQNAEPDRAKVDHGVDDLSEADRALLKRMEVETAKVVAAANAALQANVTIEPAVSNGKTEAAEEKPTEDDVLRLEGKKVERMVAAIEALGSKLEMSAEGRVIALAYAMASCVSENGLSLEDAWAYLDRWYDEHEKANLRIGDTVIYKSNGATGQVSGYDEANGWIIVKWSHAPASPALPAMLEKVRVVEETVKK